MRGYVRRASDGINYALGEKQRHAFPFYLEGVGVTVATGSAKQKVNRDKILLNEHVKLAYVGIFGMFYLLVTEILPAISPVCLNLYPKRLVMLREQAVVERYQSPRYNVFLLRPYSL